METNEKNYHFKIGKISFKYLIVLITSLFVLIPLLIKEVEMSTNTINSKETILFSNIWKISSPYIVAGIIFLIFSFAFIIKKNDKLKPIKEKGLLFTIKETFKLMFLCSFLGIITGFLMSNILGGIILTTYLPFIVIFIWYFGADKYENEFKED